jgi:hypothetical protein
MPGEPSISPEFRPFASKWRLVTRLLGLPPVLAECVPLSEAVQICELSKEEDFENALEAAAN